VLKRVLKWSGTSLVLLLAGCCGYRAVHPRISRAPTAPGGAPLELHDKVEKEPPPRASSPAEQSATKVIHEALLTGEFDRVASTIDAQAADFQALAEVRLARARAALELLDPARARSELKLVQDPELRDEVRDLRAQLAWMAPAKNEIDLELGSRMDREALLLRELGRCDGEQNQTCLNRLNAWLKVAPKKGERQDLELRARTARLETAKVLANEKTVLEDYRWLALTRPETTLGQTAPHELELRNAGLSSSEREKRFIRLSELRALDQLALEFGPTANGKRPRVSLDVLRARAQALYDTRQNESATQAFDELAALDSNRTAEYQYLAARCLIRANQDLEARRRLGAIARGNGPYADHAAYQLTRLEWQSGDRRQATLGLESYLRRFRKGGRNAERAEYDLAVFHLAQNNGKAALTRLSALLLATNDVKEQARLRELLGVARLQTGDSEGAATDFRKVLELDPLSLAASLARERLSELSQGASPLLAPPEVGLEAPPEPELPAQVRRLDELGLTGEAERGLSRLAHRYRTLPDAERKRTECTLFGKLERAEKVYRLAQANASAKELRFLPEGRHRWHWECLYPRPHRDSVREVAEKAQVPAALIYAIMRQESAFRSEVVSPAGAIGLMQLMPQTASRVARDQDMVVSESRLFAPRTNMLLGTHYLEHLWDLFGTHEGEAPRTLASASLGQVGLVVLAYNAGPFAVARWLKQFGDVPLDIFFALVPYEETRNYGYRVLGNLARYEMLEFGQVRTELLSLKTPESREVPGETY
jgi:soluble lytic murein transglycosylase